MADDNTQKKADVPDHRCYPREKIAPNNPYYCCSACKRSDIAIDGKLENHAYGCTWVKKIKQEMRLAAYQKAINSIDDYFEYANESARDRAFVHKVLATLLEDLVQTK